MELCLRVVVSSLHALRCPTNVVKVDMLRYEPMIKLPGLAQGFTSFSGEREKHFSFFVCLNPFNYKVDHHLIFPLLHAL